MTPEDFKNKVTTLYTEDRVWMQDKDVEEYARLVLKQQAKKWVKDVAIIEKKAQEDTAREIYLLLSNRSISSLRLTEVHAKYDSKMRRELRIRCKEEPNNLVNIYLQDVLTIIKDKYNLEEKEQRGHRKSRCKQDE